VNRLLSAPGQWGAGWRIGAALLCLFVLAAPPERASAHAFLERSEPAANDVLPEAPAEILMWFTEPLEPSYTGAQLFDVRGEPVDTPDAVVDPDDPYHLRLPLPGDLAPGTYTVAWRNISTADGHPAEGFFAFTIGSDADIAVPVAPATADFGGQPTWVEATGRWLVLLGLMAPLGMLLVASWVLPGGGLLGRAWPLLRAISLACLGLALAGSIVLLVDQTLTVESSFSLGAAGDLLADSRFGRYWLLRAAAIAALAVGLAVTRRLDAAPRWQRIALILLAALPLIPISLNSHAAAVGQGDAAAVVSDVAHMLAGGAWVGGLLGLLVALYLLRRTAPDERRGALGAIIRRFSTLAIASVLVLVASGLYATWLQVGGLDALRETDHGRTLALKLALMLAMVCLGAINLLLLEPRLRAGRSSGLEFRRTVAAEVLLGVGLLVLVGILTSLPPARGALASEGGRLSERLEDGGRRVGLVITPGAVGANRYTVDVHGGGHADHGGVALLRFSSAALAGVREVELELAGDHRYEAAGSELSVVGDWDVEVILRQPGAADWRAATRFQVGEQPPVVSVPGEAARFPGVPGALSVLAVLIALPLVVLGLRGQAPRLVAVAGGVLLVVAIAGLLLTAVDPEQRDATPSEPEPHHHARDAGRGVTRDPASH